jgi:hypothetical protein
MGGQPRGRSPAAQIPSKKRRTWITQNSPQMAEGPGSTVAETEN